MIALRRSAQRHHRKDGKHETWLTFDPDGCSKRYGHGYDNLENFDESLLPPGGTITHTPREDVEIFTYVFRGALVQEDSTGFSGVIHAGEFQSRTSGPGILHKETNASQTHWVHVFRIFLRPLAQGLEPARQQERFGAAERRNRLCVVASPDERRKSLRVLQDAVIYSSVLDAGHHVIHELSTRRSAWLHVIYGEVTLHDVKVTDGGGVGAAARPSLSFTAVERSEVLLIDLGPVAPSPRDGRVGQ